MHNEAQKKRTIVFFFLFIDIPIEEYSNDESLPILLFISPLFIYFLFQFQAISLLGIRKKEFEIRVRARFRSNGNSHLNVGILLTFVRTTSIFRIFM